VMSDCYTAYFDSPALPYNPARRDNSANYWIGLDGRSSVSGTVRDTSVTDRDTVHIESLPKIDKATTAGSHRGLATKRGSVCFWASK
jgi:hypothetical protein